MVSASALTARSERAGRLMLFLREKFLLAFPDEQLPIDPGRIAIWAYSTGMWKPKETAPQEVLRRKLCRAFRHEYVEDPQGREVRANFAAVEEVMTADGPKRVSRFYPIFKAPPEVVRQALAIDRRQALSTVKQMKLDFDSYNDNNDFGAMLPPLDLDFNKDIEEMSLSSEYDPDPYGDEEDDDL
jgi:hypothetical protein